MMTTPKSTVGNHQGQEKFPMFETNYLSTDYIFIEYAINSKRYKFPSSFALFT